MASPHPKPIEVARLTGATDKNPARYRNRAKAPKPAAGLGAVPDYLTSAATVVWLETVPGMVDGVLTVADRIAWCSLCELEAERREAPRDFSGAKFASLISLLARFGMTPSDRAKVSVTDDNNDKPANPFGEFGAN